MSIDQSLDSALVHHRAGRLREAEAIYRAILAQFPRQPDALHLLGAIAHGVKRYDEAVELIRRAIAINPLQPAYHNNLATALTAAGRLPEAIAAWKQLIALAPNQSQPWTSLGKALAKQGLTTESTGAFRQAAALRPDSAEAWADLAAMLAGTEQIQDAADAARRALSLDPRCARAHYSLGTVLKDTGRIHEGIRAYRQALVFDPKPVACFSNILYGLHFDPGADPRAIYHEHCLFNAVHARPLEVQVLPCANDRTPERRLRVGYVSPDFRAHSTSLFTGPLFTAHDRTQVEVYCYSDVAAPDLLTGQLRASADVWRSIVGLSDERAAEVIVADRIDILVDLALHTSHGRPLLFARKPAPVQVTWLGYPGTTGLNAMDYRITDAHIDPPGLNDAYYFEQSVRLPDTMWCYEPIQTEIVPGTVPATGAITFGCLNNYCKVNDQVVSMFIGALQAVSGSKLLLVTPPGEARSQLLKRMADEGIAAERVEFAPRRPWKEYMGTYHQIDIALDTYPWNGHTTSLDALWMGVPVVSLCGQTAVSRAGLCYLSNLGLTDLVAHTPGEYIEIATRLAADQSRRQELRRVLQERMRRSPLTDSRRFARNMEAAFREMWRKWCDGTTKPLKAWADIS